ncbi:MAG: UvrD-helicase domain-containing protein [Patescibacteria group bacterium]
MSFSLENYQKQQREAIQQTEGPLLVISGAGTGKTHLITGKILYLIQELGVAPEQILALTFTEKATEEMARRIDQALPLGHSEICIKTFHSFAEAVLRERGHEIGLQLDYKVLKEADLWMFLKHHVLDLKLEHYRTLGNPQKFLRALQEYFSRLQDEDIQSKAYIQYAKDAAKQAPTPEEKESASKHAELAKAYDIYERLLLENGSLDFSGLLFYTIRLFENRPSVLAEYQNRFTYILVDEFQDTNFAQNKIVQLLAQKNRNLTVVGDDDQSIYKWRGASLTNIHSFQKLFPEAKTVVLCENYRSHQKILDLAYATIQKNNPNRLEVSQSVNKKLISRPSHSEAKQLMRPEGATTPKKMQEFIPQVFHFEQLQDEVAFIVSKAKIALKQGQNPAILVRTNSLAKPFIEAFKEKGLPFQHFSASSIFEKPAIKDCVAFLRIIANPWDDLALFRCLTLPFWKIPMESLLEIAKKARNQNRSFYELLNVKPFDVSKKLISTIIEFSRERKVSEVLGKFLTDSGYLESARKEALEADQNNSDSHLRIEEIAQFSQMIADYEASHPHKQVSDFLQYVQFAEEAGEGRASGENIDPAAIKILTIHSAKGLEFDAVFLPGLVQSKFPGINWKDPFEIPPALIPEPLPPGDHHLEEERRLFYVAITRAKSILMMTYSDFYDGKKKWKPSVFVEQALESGKAMMISQGNGLKKKMNLQASLLGEEAIRPHQSLHLQLPKLSYSQLDAFQTCPLKYQFRYLWNVPTPMPAAVNFGSSIHNTLRDFHEWLNENPQKKDDDLRPELQKFFEENWIGLGYESRAIMEDQKERGHAMLQKYWEHEKTSLSTPAFLEKAFTLQLGKITLSGRIDRIDKLEDGTYEVIDYKTGTNHKKNLSKDLQLSLYALACRDVLKIEVSRLSLYFLETLEKVSTTRDDQEIDLCRQEIEELSLDLARSDFSPTPGFHCGYCDFRLICPSAMAVVR